MDEWLNNRIESFKKRKGKKKLSIWSKPLDKKFSKIMQDNPITNTTLYFLTPVKNKYEITENLNENIKTND